jgi:gliding motility-associated-like protein
MFRLFILWFGICSIAFAQAQNTYQQLLESGDVLLRNPKLNEKGNLTYLQGVSVSATERKAYLAQLNANGEIRWTKSIGQAAFSSNIVDILPVSDGIIAPVSEINPLDKNAYFLLKLDTLGKEIWNIQLADNTPNTAPLVCEDQQQQLWVSFDIKENNDSKTIIGQVAADGKINFLKAYFPASNTLISGIVWSEKSQSLIFSMTVNDGGSPRNVLGAIDKNGNLLWAWKAVGFRFGNPMLFDNKIVLYSYKTSFQATDILSIHDISNGKVLTTKSLDDIKSLSSNPKTLVLQYANQDAVVAYNSNFSTIWAYKYPTCTAQSFVEININNNDDCVIWKKVLDKTVVTRPTQNGLLASCGQIKMIAPQILTIEDKNFIDVRSSFQVSDFMMPTNPKSIQHKGIATFSSKPFCPDLPQADFGVPDSICMNSNITPLVSTNASFSNIWIYDFGKIDKKQYPTLNLTMSGKSPIIHIVENGTCSDTTTHIVKVLARPDIPFRDTTICDANINPEMDFNIKGVSQYWLDGIKLNPPIKRIEKEGFYQLKVSNGVCESEKIFYIKKTQAPDIQFDTDKILCKNEPFFAQIKGFEKVYWDGKLSDTIRITDDKTHSYQASLSNCKAQGALKIERKECTINIFVPNIFSPNDDGINDLIEPMGFGFQVIDFQIFNRWGNLVFQSEPNKIAWNGKFRDNLAPDGVYVYTLTFLNEKTNEHSKQIGTFLFLKSGQ